MDVVVQSTKGLNGTLELPPDKAICHRAVLAAAIANGETELTPWPDAEDCQRTLGLVQSLGVRVTRTPSAVRIEGRAPGGLQAPVEDLWCGESGTTLRLAAGLLAGQPFSSRLTAEPSLSQRPMRRIIEPLVRMGAAIDGVVPTPGSPERCPPLTVYGRRPLRAVRYAMPVASAQVKSAILLAGVFADGPTSVIEPHPTRDHTERMLRCFGATVRSTREEITVEPAQLAAPGRLEIPGDVSSAAFFIVAALCVPKSRLVFKGIGLNPSRTGLLSVLRRMGAVLEPQVEMEAWEPRGSLVVASEPLRGIDLSAEEVPAVIDELPIVMVAAACAHGTTRLCGLAELRVKETDRIQSMVRGLSQLGSRIRIEEPDTVVIEGGPLRGGVVDSAGDHRTAMSLAVAGLVATGSTTVRGAGCVAKSFPDFFNRLHRLDGSPTVKAVDKA